MKKSIVEQIKEDEGFRGNPYEDSLSIPTIGYGTKLPLTESESELILQFRLNQKINDLLRVKPIVLTLSLERQEVLFNLAYQLGVNGLLKFKNMWKYIDNGDFTMAAVELLDSRYAQQTPKRAYKNAEILKGYVHKA